MKFQLKYKQYGANSILVEWPQIIDKSILNDILTFKSKLEKANILGIESLNHAYASLIIIFNEGCFNFSSEVHLLKEIYQSSDISKKISHTLWKIPVCYHESFGIDLKVLSKGKQITVDEIIKKHTKPIYTIFFIGFLPGFLYLGGLDKALYAPRRKTPRLKIEKGAVAIGGEQTGVYPNESPGGWNIIGNSPIHFFDVLKTEPCFAKAGDSLRFYSITLEEFSDIKTLVNAGVYQIESEVIHG